MDHSFMDHSAAAYRIRLLPGKQCQERACCFRNVLDCDVRLEFQPEAGLD